MLKVENIPHSYMSVVSSTMLYDRSYMKAKKVTYEWPVMRWILITLVIAYVVQCVAHWSFDSNFVETHFGLSWQAIREFKLWTIFTYAILHDPNSPFHLLFNALAAFFLGRYIQTQMGSKNFIKLTLGSMLIGGIAWLISHIAYSSKPHLLIGFSAAVTGYLAVFCLKNWFERIRMMLFFVLPIETTGKILFFSFLAFEVGFFLAVEVWRGYGLWGIAHSAHLGGILAGWAFFRYALGESIHGRLYSMPQAEGPHWYQRRPSVVAPAFKQKVNVSRGPKSANSKVIKAEVDRILDKINDKGFGALSPEEREILDKAREILKN